jgi:hypothetical protein
MRFTVGFRALTLSALAMACVQFQAGAQTQSSFSEHTLYNSSNLLSIAAHGDFNGDGREDLIVAETSNSGTGGTYQLFLSNGDGTYDAPIALTTPTTEQVVVGDFNGDGKLDYAALDVPNSYVRVFINQGNNTFREASDLSASSPGAGPLFIVAADMNHDNITDIVIYGASSATSYLFTWMMNNYGTGDHGTSVTSGVVPNGYQMYTGDFDGDGKPDVAVIETGLPGSASTVQVWYGDGKGNLGAPASLTETGGWWDFADSVGDVDGNGTSDLLGSRELYGTSGTSQYPAQVLVIKGNTNRTLTSQLINTPSGCSPFDVHTADINGDGLNDLLYEEDCNAAANTAIVADLATGKGVFSSSEETIRSNPYATRGFAVLKSTQGTKPDLAVAPYTNAATTSATARTTELVLMENTTAGSSFPGCGTTAQAFGINVCVPTGTSANSPVNFSISASGPTPMRTVAVWADGQKVSEQLTHAFSNYSFLDQPVTLSAGAHNITVYGTGWDNTLQSKSFSLTVGGGSGCGAPASPGVNVCKPANGSTVGSPVEVQATATITGTLARMEIWVDGTKMFTETTSTSFDTSLALANGSHKIDVYAANTAGNLWETTTYATVGMSNGCAAPSSPGVNVCSPVNGSTVHSPVHVTAAANIAGTLARMEIWANGGKMYTETTSTQLNTTLTLGAGTYQFDIYAVNTQGAKYLTTVHATVQ